MTPPAEPADTLAGQPVRFTATGLTVTPAGVTQTKADTDFSTMTVYMTDTDDNTWQADYTYNETNSTWQADGEPLYWPTSKDQYTFTAISPKGTDPHITLPTAWTEADLAKYETIRATSEAKRVSPSTSPVSLTLCPALTKVQVVSMSGQPVSLIDAPMAGILDLTDGTTEDAATGIMTLYSPEEDGLNYEGYVLPAGKSGFGFLSDNVYKVETKLKAGTVVTTCDMEGSAAIVCPEPGKLKDVWPGDNPQKLVITGMLNDADLKTINNHKGEIVNLYVMGGIAEDSDWDDLNMPNATLLQSVYLAEATSIETSAFHGCSALESINLPQATDIGARAFNMCSALTSICLPKNATIETDAFQECDKLTTLFLSDKGTTEAEAQEKSNWGGITWQTIHYGYQGTGDYLNPDNYTGHWPETTN